MALQILINGLMIGGVYAILAVGFSLVFGVAKMFNMAHTAFYMAAAFFTFIGISMAHLPLSLSIFLSIVTVVILGILCFVLFFDRVKEHESAIMIISISLAMLFQEIFLLTFGASFRNVPHFVLGFVEIFDIRVSFQCLFAIGSSAIILITLWLLLFKTKIGSAIRAVAEDTEIANLVGINTSRIYLIVMAISVMLAGLTAAIISPIFMITPFMWTQPLIIVLAAVILGGLGSIGGSVIGAFILGYAETFVTFLLPGGSFLRGAVSMSIMVGVLLIRPEGLFGVVFEEERL